MATQPPSNQPGLPGPGAVSKPLRDAGAKPVQRRLLIPLAVVMLLLVGGFEAVLLSTQRIHLHRSLLEKLGIVAFDMEDSLEEESRMLSSIEEGLLRDVALRDTLKTQDRDRLLADYEPIFTQLREDYGITRFYFHRPDRVNLLRVHTPERNGDLIERFTAREAERTGRAASGIELGLTGTFTLRVVQPVFEGDTLIGYLELGEEFENILADIGKEHGVELVLTIQKRLLNRENWEAGMKLAGREGDWDRLTNVVMAYTSLGRFPTDCEHFVHPDGAHAHGDQAVEAEFDGKSWIMMASPLSDAGGADVGDLIVLRDVSQAKADSRRLLLVSSGAALVLMAVLLSFLYVALRRVDRGISSQQEDLHRSNAAVVGALEREKRAGMELQAALGQLESAVQKADRANRSKSEFLANMSHEIRTPMTAILGFTAVLLEFGDLENAPPERIEAAKTIKQNGEYLLHLIDDILDLSKIEAGRMTTERMACSPCRLVAEVTSLVRVRADAKGLPLEIEYAGPVPETIQTKPTRLRQILINLLGNAIKFTEVGEVRLVTRFVGDGPAAAMQFDVVETGLGMTEEQVARVFQPFTQADTSMTRKFGGTGLGLAISRRLAELLAGSITVAETRPGAGTRMRLTVATGPLDGVKMIADPLAATVLTPDTTTTNADQPALHDCRILVAEDGPDNRRLIAHVLNKAGAQVNVEENGRLAVEAALAARDAGQSFDVILMDMQMPVMDGYEATKLLRREGYTDPIVALTAHAMGGDREKCIQAGCNDYASKPIDRKNLIEIIREQLGQAAIQPSAS